MVLTCQVLGRVQSSESGSKKRLWNGVLAPVADLGAGPQANMSSMDMSLSDLCSRTGESGALSVRCSGSSAGSLCLLCCVVLCV